MRKLKYTCVIGAVALQAGFCTSWARADAIAGWHFDETSGANAAAAVGSVNGALQGDAAFTTTGGISGGAVNMSTGGNGLVNMGNNFNFTGANTFSLVAWVQTGNGDTNGYIVAGKHQATVIAGYFLGVNNTSSGSGEVTGGGLFYKAYPNPVSADLDLNDGGWHQIVGVNDIAGNQARLYVDGVLQDTEVLNAFNATGASFAVGGVLNAAGNQMISTLTGKADEVSIWDHALSDSDVTFLFNNPGALAIPEPAGATLLAMAAGAATLRRRRGSR